MSRQIAYLVAAPLRPELHAAIEAGTYPRPEYAVFLQRNPVRLFEYRDLEPCRLRLIRASIERHQRHWTLPLLPLTSRTRYRGLIASGEDTGLPLAIYARLFAPTTPVYIIAHGSYFRSEKFRKIMRLLRLSRKIHFLCLSESLRSTLITKFGVRAAQVHNTGYGVDTCFFAPKGDPPIPNLVASAGIAWRDYRTLVEAVTGMDVELKIAADSAWYPADTNIKDEPLPPNVECRSFGDYVGLRELYARAQFVVVPLYDSNHAKGYAVIAEAMAMGKPVITTATAANSDFVREGETGFYVRPHDVNDLREKMECLLNSPALAQRMGRHAREYIEAEFSVEAYCTKIERAMGLTE